MGGVRCVLLDIMSRGDFSLFFMRGFVVGWYVSEVVVFIFLVRCFGGN